MRRAWVRVIFFSALVLLVAGAAVSVWVYHRYTRPGPLTAGATVIVPKGAGLDAITRRLVDAGVIDGPAFFKTMMRVTRRSARLRAGEFEFPARVSVREVSHTLLYGAPVKRRLTVAEGLTARQIFDLVAAAKGLEGDLPPPVREGTLLPETYFYTYGDTRAALIGRMQQAMRETLDELWPKRAEGLSISDRREAVVLASIIEKETSIPEERATVASVFYNRLRSHMRLQFDATVVYALTAGGGALGRRLTQHDLELDSPYNTYRIYGLPPGPIANPGRASLQAALNPAKTKYLYYVADGSGGHVFSRTLAEHNRNVERWRRIKRQRRRAGGQ